MALIAVLHIFATWLQRTALPLIDPMKSQSLIYITIGVFDGLRYATLFVIFAWLAIDRSNVGRRASICVLALLVHVVTTVTSFRMYQFAPVGWEMVPYVFHVPALAVIAYVAGFSMRFLRRWTIDVCPEDRKFSGVDLASMMELTVVIALVCVFFVRWASTFHGSLMAISFELMYVGVPSIGVALSVCCLFRIILTDSTYSMPLTSMPLTAGQISAWVWLFIIHSVVWVAPFLGGYYPTSWRMSFQQNMESALMVVSVTATATIAASLGVICLRRIGYRLRSAADSKTEDTADAL